MAAPSTPTQFYVQQGNGQVLVSWAQTVGATSYSVKRSLDNITYTEVATPVTYSYLDAAVTYGVQYFYKVSAVNSSGTSAYTAPASAVPAQSGEMSLCELRLRAQQRADRVNSSFITLPEWNSYINQSMFELYDLLVTAYEDYFLALPVIMQPNGVDTSYPLPDGVLYEGAKPFYKVVGVDLSVNQSNDAWATVKKFNYIDRNKYVYANTPAIPYGIYNVQYRVMGKNIEFIPLPVANQVIRIQYIPRLTMLLQETDLTDISISGWLEYVITDVAIKALQKEESDVTVLAAQKMMLLKRIEETASNRDAGQPDTISMVRNKGYFGFGGFGDGYGNWGY